MLVPPSGSSASRLTISWFSPFHAGIRIVPADPSDSPSVHSSSGSRSRYHCATSSGASVLVSWAEPALRSGCQTAETVSAPG